MRRTRIKAKCHLPILALSSFTLLWGLLASAQESGEVTLRQSRQNDATISTEQILNRSPLLDLSELEEIDDLQSLKNDVGDFFLGNEEKKSELNEEKAVFKRPQSGILELKESTPKTGPDLAAGEVGEIIADLDPSNGSGPQIFDAGKEEKMLLDVSRFVESKIPAQEWNEIATSSRLDKYVVQRGDWLWKISQKLFGSGFYYSKIWALNPHITNPHEIEPGMTLIFDSGTATDMPQVRFGNFDESRAKKGAATAARERNMMNLLDFGEGIEPTWLNERQKLLDQGIFFQYASEETYEDLAKLGGLALNREYERYEPPTSEIIIKEPGDAYDDLGFDRDSKISFNVKDGFFLNTFVTTNIVQDLGEIVAGQTERVFLQKYDRVYVKFDAAVKVKPGDKFSVYTPEGRVAHKISDRRGYRYTVLAQVEVVKKINDVWECEIFDLTGVVKRTDRLTVYTPRIDQILMTFSPRNIEAALIDSFRDTANGLSFGDVVYIDRGRADGVELGNIFELYSFIDRSNGRRITIDPTYKIGEITVITLTDNFATALISQSTTEIGLGTIALSKTSEQAALADKVRGGKHLEETKLLQGKALEELDIELNLDNFAQDLLDRADRVELTEDELEELERQERERSVISDHERDLRELERLEREIVEAEASLNEAKVDEDKFLEQHDLEKIEGQVKEPDPNAFHSLNEIESEFGRKYLDEDLNAKDNPFGLTEYDLEEIDELLNTETQ